MSDGKLFGSSTATSDSPGTKVTVGAAASVCLLFALLSFLSEPIPGVNEPHYLTKARATVTDWCTRDPFLMSRPGHWVFFHIAGPLTAVMPFAVVAAVGRIAGALVLGAGWCLCAARLSLSSTATIAAAALFSVLLLAGSLSGEWIIGGFESKVPAYGFALIGLGLWAGPDLTPGRACAAGLSFGTATALHPVAGGWIFLGAASAELLSLLPRISSIYEARRSTESRKRIGAAAGRFLPKIILMVSAALASAPGVLPALQLLMTAEASKADRDTANFIQVFGRLKHHLDPMEFGAAAWIWLALVSLCLTVLTIRLSRRGLLTTAHRRLLHIVLFALAIGGAGVGLGMRSVPAVDLPDWQFRASLLKFYPFRMTDAVLPLVTALFAGSIFSHLSGSIENRERTPATNFRQSALIRFGVPIVLSMTALTMAVRSRSVAPAGYNPTTFAQWRQICNWIRSNTDPDALFVTPRESFGFKWFAERAEYVCYKDCPQDAAGIVDWNNRHWAIHRWSAEALADQTPELRYSAEDLRQLGEDTGAEYVLTRTMTAVEIEPVRQFGPWQLFRLRE